MSTTSFWRKSAPQWGMCLAMICTGSGSALSYSTAGIWVSLVVSIIAFTAALVYAIMVVRSWLHHRRAKPAG